MLRNAEFTRPETVRAAALRGQGGNKHGGSPWSKRGVEPGRAPAGEGREPVGCVELAMTHRSASRCVFATHPTCWRPGNVVCPQRSPGTCSSAPRPTPFAVGRKLGSFSCSIPPSFVLSHNMPMINITSNWLRFNAFLRGPAVSRDDAPTPLLDSTALGTGAILTRRVSMESPGVTRSAGYPWPA